MRRFGLVTLVLGALLAAPATAAVSESNYEELGVYKLLIPFVGTDGIFPPDLPDLALRPGTQSDYAAIGNYGSAPVDAANAILRVYYSNSNTLGPGACLKVERTVADWFAIEPSGARSTVLNPVNAGGANFAGSLFYLSPGPIPCTTPGRSVYTIVVIDADNVIAEENEANNTLVVESDCHWAINKPCVNVGP